ncbi:DMT family transporter [Lysinibacillus sp. Ag94]|uniref:DMT family transporter n=1 Tax=Lysinibacillus sp. Ag94 TaxID=2936682 RepID=UPI00200E789D|nr:DMT family transporter [Lysinibacillus sp. Ag94]UPW84447.1 DMT family transporter [Lysinibacillus sp. Ag94]
MSRKLYFALIMLSLIWGGSFYFFKILVADFNPLVVAFLRSTFGAVTLIVLIPFFRKSFSGKIPMIPLFAVGILNTLIPWTLICFSEQKMTSNLASVLNATQPLWTMVLGILLFGIHSNRNQIIGLCIGFVGILILSDIHLSNVFSVDSLNFVAMLIATFCYGLATHITKRYLKEISMFQISLGTLLVGSICSGVIVLFLEEPIQILTKLSWHHIGALIGIGTFGSGIAYLLYFYLIQKGSPNFASISTYLVPVSAIFWGYFLLNENISWRLIIGLVFILIGVYITSQKIKLSAPIKVIQKES